MLELATRLATTKVGNDGLLHGGSSAGDFCFGSMMSEMIVHQESRRMRW